VGLAAYRSTSYIATSHGDAEFGNGYDGLVLFMVPPVRQITLKHVFETLTDYMVSAQARRLSEDPAKTMPKRLPPQANAAYLDNPTL